MFSKNDLLTRAGILPAMQYLYNKTFDFTSPKTGTPARPYFILFFIFSTADRKYYCYLSQRALSQFICNTKNEHIALWESKHKAFIKLYDITRHTITYTRPSGVSKNYLYSLDVHVHTYRYIMFRIKYFLGFTSCI